MIAIIGTTPDDILYFKTKMIIEKEETLASKVTCYIGRFAKTDVVVAATGHTNMLTSLVLSSIIIKYDPYLVFNIGLVTSIVNIAKQGDLFIAERIYVGNVNTYGFGRVTYSNIPNMPDFFFTEEHSLKKIEASISAVTNKYCVRGSLYSSDIFYTEKENIVPILSSHFIQGTNLYTIDCESAGIYLAGNIFSVPVITLKVVSYELANDVQLVNFVRKGLEVMPIVGKVITNYIKENINE